MLVQFRTGRTDEMHRAPAHGWSRTALALALLLASLVLPDVTTAAAAGLAGPRIVNGLTTFDYPAAGILLLGNSASDATLTCSGTLIGCSTFLVAAHCVCDDVGSACQSGDASEPDPSQFQVFLQHGGFAAVDSIDVHPDFDFPTADVAVVHLSSAIDGITPMPLNTTVTPPAGSSATIVGFGRTGGASQNYGIKRRGEVETLSCGTPTLLCWNFEDPIGSPGDDSNTCNGDSGGPLFWHDGTRQVLAGITSGGTADDCLPFDESYDTNVFDYRSWIASQVGADLGGASCGVFAPAGIAPTTVSTAAGDLSAATPDSHQAIPVPGGTGLLRVTMNASQQGAANFDLYLRFGAQASTSIFDCRKNGSSQFASCEIPDPAAGTWWLLVHRQAGTAPFQVTSTVFRSPVVTPTPGPTPTQTPVSTPTPIPTPTPPPTALSIAAPGQVVCGTANTLNGAGFTAGSRVKIFVSTFSGSQAFGPYTPSARAASSLTWTPPCDVPLGRGFLTLRVINTDQGYFNSNTVPALFFASPNSGLPTISGLNDIALEPAASMFPLAYVETLIAEGAELVLNGTGFDPLAKLNFFTASGNAGPLDAKPGSTSTRLLIDIPPSVPTGPGSLQLLNRPYGTLKSNAVSAPIGATPAITSITQLGQTITVHGAGFSTLSVVNIFNGETNRCGMVAGVAQCPITLISDQEFRIQRPALAVAGSAYIKVLNPPFIPFTSSGSDPDGSFTLN